MIKNLTVTMLFCSILTTSLFSMELSKECDSNTKKVDRSNLKTPQKQEKLGDITYYDRCLQSPQPEFLGRPSFNDFLKHGFLVHVGRIALNYNNKEKELSFDRPVNVAYNFVTYWCLNSPTTAHMFFQKACTFGTNTVIIKPFRNCVNRLVSLCAPEVMLAGNVPIEAGDIFIYPKRDVQRGCFTSLEMGTVFELPSNVRKERITAYEPGSDKPTIDGIYTPEEAYALLYMPYQEFEAGLKKHGILSVPYDVEERSPGYFFSLSSGEIDKQTDITHTIIKELGGWDIHFTQQGWWTHLTELLIDNRTVKPTEFLSQIFEELPQVSDGYEFYSRSGIGSLCRIMSNLIPDGESQVLSDRFYIDFPELYKKLWDFAYGEMKEHIMTCQHYSALARKEMLADLLHIAKMEKEAMIACESTDDADKSKELVENLYRFSTPLSPDLFHKFGEFVLSTVSEDVREIICLSYQLLDNYRNTHNYERTAMLKRTLLDKTDLVFQRKIYVDATGFDFLHNSEDSISEIDIKAWFGATIQ